MPRLHHHLVLAAALAFTSALACGAPATYTLVSKVSRVTFSLEHQGFIQLFGTLRLTPGNIVFDTEDWSKSAIQVSMPVNSIDMGDAVWNGQIRDDEEWAKLFGTASIDFRSTRIERTDASHGKLYGDLTLAGVTRPVALDLRVNKIGKNEVSEFSSVGFSATTTLKRSQFGLDAYADLVGDDIVVQIQIEAAQGVDGDAKHDLSALGVTR